MIFYRNSFSINNVSTSLLAGCLCQNHQSTLFNHSHPLKSLCKTTFVKRFPSDLRKWNRLVLNLVVSEHVLTATIGPILSFKSSDNEYLLFCYCWYCSSMATKIPKVSAILGNDINVSGCNSVCMDGCSHRWTRCCGNLLKLYDRPLRRWIMSEF